MSEIFGPYTTTDLRGLGGPLNRWDNLILAARQRGDIAAVAELKKARAKVALAFSPFTPVFIDRSVIERMNRANKEVNS